VLFLGAELMLMVVEGRGGRERGGGEGAGDLTRFSTTTSMGGWEGGGEGGRLSGGGRECSCGEAGAGPVRCCCCCCCCCCLGMGSCCLKEAEECLRPCPEARRLALISFIE